MSWDKEIYNIDNYHINIGNIIDEVKNTCKYDIEVINPLSRSGINIRETGDIDLIIDDMTGIFMSRDKNTIEIDALRLSQKSEENTLIVQKDNTIGVEHSKSNGSISQKDIKFDYINEYVNKKILNNKLGTSKVIFDEYDISILSDTLNINTLNLVINGIPIDLQKLIMEFAIYEE